MMLVGILILVLDPLTYRFDSVTAKNGHQYKKSAILTDLMLVLSNIVTACFFMLNQLLMKERAFKHFVLLNVTLMIVLSVLAVLVNDARLDISTAHGLFGWLDARHAFLTIFVNGFVATFLATLGPIICLQFYTSKQCLNAFLLEPWIAMVLGCVFQLDTLPSILTILGLLGITVALYQINNRDSPDEGEQMLPIPADF